MVVSMCNYAQVEFSDGKWYKQAAKATLKIRGGIKLLLRG